LLDVLKPMLLRHNRWRCDHGWDVDLDDGSSHYVISDNLFLNGGLKLREGYQRIVTNNIIVNNSLHPHCWYAASDDVFSRNIVMGAYRPAGGMPVGRWGSLVDFNLFTTSERDRLQFAAQGCDANSVVADPLFVDAAAGDFRVRDGSPALQLGFRNFAMDGFGVTSARLRALARGPVLPTVKIQPDLTKSAEVREPSYGWRGARIREIRGEEFSAYGVPRESGGVVFVRLPENAQAHRDGFRSGDLIQAVDGRPTPTVATFSEALTAPSPGEARQIVVVRNQSQVTIRLGGAVEPPRL
jgi:hypothetical protein